MPEADMILNAEVRENVGKGDAMKVRKLNRLPAVVYGPDLKENLFVTLDYMEFEKVFKTYGTHHVFTLHNGKQNIKVIVKDFKIHPISRKFLHVDLFAVNAKKPFNTQVPIHYMGTPIGVKEGGGLFVFTRKVLINTDLANLPTAIEVDITSLKIGQYYIIRDIQKKSNYKILTHEGTTLVEVK